MIWQELTYVEMKKAYAMSQELPVEMRGNYSGNDPLRRLAGYVGQVAAHKYLTGSENIDAFDYDLLYNGLRVEIKTTFRNVAPLSTYTARVACANSNQICDIYLFASAQCERGKFLHGCWLVGWITKSEMKQKMWYSVKGKKDFDGFIERGDSLKILISNLRTMPELDKYRGNES